jgi:NADPH:quinone reductase-like Zn-dependent oxidoreductase
MTVAFIEHLRTGQTTDTSSPRPVRGGTRIVRDSPAPTATSNVATEEMPRMFTDVTLGRMAEFDGKTVLITGGGTGLGLATARRLVDAGANVVLAGRRVEKIDAAAKELDPSGDRVLAVGADVSRTDDLDELAAEIRNRFGRLDGVFANAGVAHASPSQFVTEEDFDRVVGINLKGVYFTIQKAVPLFDAGGYIVGNGKLLVHCRMGLANCVPLNPGSGVGEG